MPSSTATRLTGRPALTSAAARARNSAGFGLGMIGAFQNRPDPQSPEVTNPWGRSPERVPAGRAAASSTPSSHREFRAPTGPCVRTRCRARRTPPSGAGALRGRVVSSSRAARPGRGRWVVQRLRAVTLGHGAVSGVAADLSGDREAGSDVPGGARPRESASDAAHVVRGAAERSRHAHPSADSTTRRSSRLPEGGSG